MSVRLIIERKSTGLNWEVVAHPGNDIDEALGTLKRLQEKEQNRRYKGRLRLIRETREFIADDGNYNY